MSFERASVAHISLRVGRFAIPSSYVVGFINSIGVRKWRELRLTARTSACCDRW